MFIFVLFLWKEHIERLHCFVGCDQVRNYWTIAGLWDDIQELMDNADGFVDFFLLAYLTSWLCGYGLSSGGETIWFGKEKISLHSCWLTKPTMSSPSGILLSEKICSCKIELWRQVALVETIKGEFKYNIDATVNSDQQRYGMGNCVRNDKGEFVFGKNLLGSGLHSVDWSWGIGSFGANLLGKGGGS